MRTPEQVRRDALRAELGYAQDNLYRARHAQRCSKDASFPHGESGKSLNQIVSEYEEWVKEVEAAL